MIRASVKLLLVLQTHYYTTLLQFVHDTATDIRMIPFPSRNDSEMGTFAKSSPSRMGHCVRAHSIATVFRFNDIHTTIPVFARAMADWYELPRWVLPLSRRSNVSQGRLVPKGWDPASQAVGVSRSWVA